MPAELFEQNFNPSTLAIEVYRPKSLSHSIQQKSAQFKCNEL